MSSRRIGFFLLIALTTLLVAPALGHAYEIEQYLEIKRAHDGRFSSDETWVAYLTNISGTDQIWRIPITGGEPVQITDFDEPVDGFEVHPTQDKILFWKDKGGNENHQLFMIDADGKNLVQLTDSPDRRFMTPQFSPDGSKIACTANLRNKKYFDIHLIDPATGQIELLRKVNGYNTIETWSPDGTRLVVSTWDNSYNNNLHLLDVVTKEHTLLTPHEGWAIYHQVVWPADKFGKKRFFLTTNIRQSFTKVGIFHVKKRHIDIQDTAPWDTNNLCVSGNGNVLGSTLNVLGYSQVVLIDRKKEAFWATPKLPKGVIKSMRISGDASKVLFTFSSPVHNTDVWIYDKKTDKIRRLTNSPTGGIDPGTFIRPELIEYIGAGGLEINAFFYKPPGAKKDGKTPLILYMHGGPESQERPDFATTFQYFLNKGFAIFAPNVRGSEGYGKQFIHLDDGAFRPLAVQDAAQAVRWLSLSNWADPKRVGVYGGSYGGYMVLALMSEYPKLFAAGIDLVGISNFVTFLERTHPSRRELREAEYGSLRSDRFMLEQISPIHKVDKITGALMVIQGANDPRVPKHEADQVVEKAKAAGVEVEYLLYEDEGHGLSKLKNRKDAYPKMAAFFEKHLAAEPEKATSQDPDEKQADEK
jgi:dipeptidyl aminopeptidase/acylaminoacyl peptidase